MILLAPLSGAVLSTVKPVAAGSGAGLYGTVTQIGNAAGVAAIGAVFFALKQEFATIALLTALSLCALSIVTCVAFMTWMRRATA